MVKCRLFLLVIIVMAVALAGCSSGGVLPGVPTVPGEPGGTPGDSSGGSGGGNSGGGSTPPPTAQVGSLTGTVVDDLSGLGFWSGTATIAGKTSQIRNGTFQITGIPVGLHTLRISKTFYGEKQVQVSVTGDTNMVSVRMNPSFGASDLDLFARLVHAESKGEPYRGQVAVAASVLNRVRHYNYPNTLRGVITQRTNGYAQYSPIDDGSINIPANQSAKSAVRDALVGWDPSLGATGFFAPAKVHNRGNWVWQQIPTIDIGNHRFFRARTD